MSEVYRAFDLINLEFVACKIHSLNEQWNQDKKRNYMKHRFIIFVIKSTRIPNP